VTWALPLEDRGVVYEGCRLLSSLLLDAEELLPALEPEDGAVVVVVVLAVGAAVEAEAVEAETAVV